jgi:hypothetical protein
MFGRLHDQGFPRGLICKISLEIGGIPQFTSQRMPRIG